MSLFGFIFSQHLGAACLAALLFGLGSLLAWPAVRFGPSFLTGFPLALYRMILTLIGRNPSMSRMWWIIFGFNGAAMFLYMASGIRPVLPAAISLLTGYNITAILLLAGKEMGADHAEGEPETDVSAWVPGGLLTILCGMAVLVIELPCFFFSIGMGVSLGMEIEAGQILYTQGLSIRAHAYALILLPLLAASAACEVIAIRGMRARG